MKCWHCETELIWGADHDIENDDTYDMVTNLHCPKCYCVIDVYYPSKKTIEEYEEYEKKHLN
jgi:hypothetical protein